MKMLKALIFILLLCFVSCKYQPNVNEKHISGYENKGVLLSEVINFKNVNHVMLHNVKGPHHLTKNIWESLKNNIVNAEAVNGLLCKPKTLAFTFEMKDGEEIEGYICGRYINFDQGIISGSFKMPEEVNYHNY